MFGPVQTYQRRLGLLSSMFGLCRYFVCSKLNFGHTQQIIRFQIAVDCLRTELFSFLKRIVILRLFFLKWLLNV